LRHVRGRDRGGPGRGPRRRPGTAVRGGPRAVGARHRHAHRGRPRHRLLPRRGVQDPVGRGRRGGGSAPARRRLSRGRRPAAESRPRATGTFSSAPGTGPCAGHAPPPSRTLRRMDPVAALKRVAYLMERERAEARRATAFRKAARRLEDLPPGELQRRIAAGTLTDLHVVGQRTAGVATEAAQGRVPDYLAALEERAGAPLAEGGETGRGWLRGDLHTHSEWSDGGSPIADMAHAAI